MHNLPPTAVKIQMKNMVQYRKYNTYKVYDGHTCIGGRLGRFRSTENDVHWLAQTIFRKKAGSSSLRSVKLKGGIWYME